MAPSPTYQPVSDLERSNALILTSAQLNVADDEQRQSFEMTNHEIMTSQSKTVATSFEPPQEDNDNTNSASEQDPLVQQETDPARFGINVQPTTTVRQLLIPRGNDGVFSNMSAKPEAGEIKEEHPPVWHSRTMFSRRANIHRHMTRQLRIMPLHIGIKPCICRAARMMYSSKALL